MKKRIHTSKQFHFLFASILGIELVPTLQGFLLNGDPPRGRFNFGRLNFNRHVWNASASDRELYEPSSLVQFELSSDDSNPAESDLPLDSIDVKMEDASTDLEDVQRQFFDESQDSEHDGTLNSLQTHLRASCRRLRND
jgi:hypothetical protein